VTPIVYPFSFISSATLCQSISVTFFQSKAPDDHMCRIEFTFLKTIKEDSLCGGGGGGGRSKKLFSVGIPLKDYENR
jgi:hypothetical protein